MNDQPTNDDRKPNDEIAPAKSAGANPAPSTEQPAPSQLSKEEQWALFEKELKESDWGHQPC